MSIRGIHHVAIIAANYARSRDFYLNTLGFTLVSEHYRAERDSWKLNLALPDFPARHPAPPGQKPAGYATWRWLPPVWTPTSPA